MNAILYNTNSSLIPKFQRHDLLKHSRELSNSQNNSKSTPSASSINRDATPDYVSIFDEAPFQSKAKKNSETYLKELCCSVYPESMHGAFLDMQNNNDLAIHAFLSLILKNFICSWYGPKIPTLDKQFLGQLFNLFQDLLFHSKTWEIDYATLFADDIPRILSNHINAMKEAKESEYFFKRYCALIDYQDNYYPATITHVLKCSLRNNSQLQKSFMDSLLDVLLFEKVINKIIEPYYLLKAISKISHNTLLRRSDLYCKREESGFGIIRRPLSVLKAFYKKLFCRNAGPCEEPIGPHPPFSYRYMFTFISNDILKLPSRRPFLHSFGRTIQFWLAKSTTLNDVLESSFIDIIKQSFANEHNIGKMFLIIRETLFPNDNDLGPATIIPHGAEFEKFKIECKDVLWAVAKQYKLDTWLSIERGDIEEFIDMLCRDKECNKILFFKVLDCIFAHIEISVTSKSR